jgi:hypothetical protein
MLTTIKRIVTTGSRAVGTLSLSGINGRRAYSGGARRIAVARFAGC